MNSNLFNNSMRGKPTGILALVLSLCGYALAQDLSSYPKEKVQLFLLAGQSNMSGRGIVSDEDKKIHTRIFALSKDGEWVPAVDPIHYDKKGAGVGPAKSFALSLVEKDKNMVIGLIPAACGGSPISTWEPGAYHQQTRSHPYDDAIARTRRAMKDGVLRGILWHQGESDCTPGKAVEYEERLRRLILRFRADLDVFRMSRSLSASSDSFRMCRGMMRKNA